MHNIIFLDVDGVLNHELWYTKINRKEMSFIDSHFDIEKVHLLNNLCKETNAKVVISSSWRIGRTLEEMKDILKSKEATFEVIDMTGTCCSGIRGVEIRNWIKNNSDKVKNYAILDDDSDMLLWQQKHFFHVDRYCGLTPTICYKIGIFFNNSIMSVV